MLRALRSIFPLFPLLALAPIAVAFAACGSDVEGASNGASASAAASSSSTSSASGGGNPCYPDSCTGPSSSTGSAAGGASGAGGGSVCGGIDNVTCAPGMFCNYSLDDCGGLDGSGVCAPNAVGCSKELIPTCGCDGHVYGNACDANTAGVDVSNLGELGSCMAPAGTFPCGSHFCATSQYCQRQISDVGGVPDSYSCLPLPAACTMGAPETCACLAKEPCGAICMQTPDGNLTVSCPGG